MKNSKTNGEDINYVQIFGTWFMYLGMSNSAVSKLDDRSLSFSKLV